MILSVQTRTMLNTLIRAQIRSILIQNGPHTCSDLVRSLGLDPRRHKGTIHAIMVDLEREGTLAAVWKNGKRGTWFIVPTAIRKRDRIAAAFMTIG
jgi:hypothetical protein